MRNLKKFNEAFNLGPVLPDAKDTSILEDIEHIFANLIEDYDPDVSEYATGVTTLKFKKQDCLGCSTIEEYHLATQKQAHLVDSIIDCINKLKIHVPDLVTRLDDGTKKIDTDSFIVYLGKEECADVISRML
jgi:hypothetical protein